MEGKVDSTRVALEGQISSTTMNLEDRVVKLDEKITELTKMLGDLIGRLNTWRQNQWTIESCDLIIRVRRKISVEFLDEISRKSTPVDITELILETL